MPSPTSAQEAPPLTLPILLGPYMLERLAGEGGSAWVYRGRAIHSGVEVAFKLLKRRHHSPALTSAFLQQGRALSALSSPYLPAVIEVGEGAWGPWWAMSWVEGARLGELLSKGVQWGSAGVYHLVDCCCEALSALHKGGLIHGDVKPDNLIYVGSPQSPQRSKMVLIDPRLELVNAEANRAHDQPFIFGTPAYMSPEHLRGEALSPASDLYSLGVLLYQLTTGVCPFTGELSQLIDDKLSQPVPPPSVRHRPWPYHAALEALILNLMSRKPGARLQSVEEVSALLKNARSKESPLTPTPSSAPWLSQTAPAELSAEDQPLSHLTFDTMDVEVTESEVLRTDLQAELELHKPKPQAVIARRPTEERQAPVRPAWVDNLVWLCVGASMAVLIMKLLS